MKAFINDLFIQLGFQTYQNDTVSLFSFTPETNKKAYWAVVEWEDLEPLADQSAIFNSCRNTVDQPELDKNLSLLILIKLNDTAKIDAAKLSIINTEENAYYFKKYVLHYADNEYEQLKTQQGAKTALEFLTQQIINSDCFKTYKNEHKSISWQSLIYRIALKLPFIPIIIKTNKGLASLFEDNQLKVTAKNLKALDEHLTAQYGSLAVKNIDDLSADDMLNKLISIIK
jgi:hypothetical protein